MKKYIVAVLIASVFVGPSWAGLQRGNQVISINVGGAVPLTDVNVSDAGGGKEKIGATGPNFGGQYLYQILPNLGIGADINYSAFGDKTSTTFIPGGDSTISSKSLVALSIVKFHFVTEGRVLPYVLGGLGFHNSSLKIDAKPSPGFVWGNTRTTETRNELDDSASNLALGLGAGLDIPVNESITLGVETRYQYLGESTYNTTVAAQRDFGVTGVKGAASMILITGRVGYKF